MRDVSSKTETLRFITTEPISAARLIQEQNFPECGAVVSFEGRVRNHHEGQKVIRLFYEVYSSMAEKEMKRLIEEIRAAWPGVRIRVIHRIGELEIGDVAVAIVVWAPHRKEAFEACEAMIDRIKSQVPLWKRETYQDGTRSWVGCEKTGSPS